MNNPGNNIIVGRGVSDVPVKSNGNIVSFGKSRYKVVKNEQGGILYRK